ncbi:MAG: AAA-associated domain-containing protein, partial [Candidatus Hydrothermarchaeales archaeon]
MSRSILDEDWEGIFESYVDTSKDINLVHTNQIKNRSRKDLRLMTKFDNYDSQPDIFKRYGYFILPLKNRGNFALVRGDGFERLEDIDTDPNIYVSRLGEQLVSLSKGHGESRYLDTAYYTGLIEEFLGIRGLYLTIRGRQYSNPFSFMAGDVGPINVESVQIEVDAGFENVDNIVLMEAKVGNPEDFNIRQLFYPYRNWLINVKNKRFNLLFFTFNPGGDTYSFWRYDFEDEFQYNSIKLREKSSFKITNPPEERLSISEVSEKKEGEELVIKDWKIPQADDFEKVVEFPFIVSRGIRNSKDISDYFTFTTRQSSYYRHATEALGLVSLDNKTKSYNLTRMGEKYVKMNASERNTLLCSLLFKLPIMSEVVEHVEKSREGQITEDRIVKIIEKNTKYNITTSRRRAQTIKSWFKWMQDTLGIVTVKNKSIR